MNLREITQIYKTDVNKFVRTGDLSEPLYDALYEYYLMTVGEMPYGVAKARDGDPVEWISEQFEQYLDL
jgi:hypothetical protein